MSGWQCTGAQLQVLASSEPNGAGDKAESGPASSDVTLGLCRRAITGSHSRRAHDSGDQR